MRSFAALDLGGDAVAPELAYVTAQYAALASFGRVAALLAELLPLSGARHASTVRNRTLRVGAQVVQPHTVETRDQPMAQGTGPVVVGNSPAAATEVFWQALAAAGVDADKPAALGGEPIATSFVESAVVESAMREIISWCMAKAQQMRWSRGTVQPFLDVRAAPVLNDTLEDAFRRRYPNSRPRTMTRPCQRRDHAPEICALFIGGGRDRPTLFSASVSVERCPQAVSSAHHRTYRRAGSGYRRGRERRSSAPPFCPAPARRPRIHKRGQPSGSGLWKATLAGRAQQRLGAGERAPRPALRPARLRRCRKAHACSGLQAGSPRNSESRLSSVVCAQAALSC